MPVDRGNEKRLGAAYMSLDVDFIHMLAGDISIKIPCDGVISY